MFVSSKVDIPDIYYCMHLIKCYNATVAAKSIQNAFGADGVN